MKEKVKSWLYLAWCTFLHFLNRIFRAIFPGKSGLEKFKENYVSEGLIPVNAKLDEIIFEALKCTSCGACDLSHFQYPEEGEVPSDIFVASFMRDISQAELFCNFRSLPEDEVCPYGVKFSAFEGLKGERR